MIINLLGKSNNSPTYIHKDGSIQYDRINERNRTITHITKKRNIVKSINRFHNTKSARKQAYKNYK